MSFIKLKPGVKHPAAAAELQVLVDPFVKDDLRDFRRDRKVAIVTLNKKCWAAFLGRSSSCFAAVIALLVIGCANVSILLLARGIARQHELAVRASIGRQPRSSGAATAHRVRAAFTRGCGLGVLAAYRGVSTLSAMLPLYSFPHEAAIRVNGTVLAFTAAVAVITGILFGISTSVAAFTSPH